MTCFLGFKKILSFFFLSRQNRSVHQSEVVWSLPELVQVQFRSVFAMVVGRIPSAADLKPANRQNQMSRITDHCGYEFPALGVT